MGGEKGGTDVMCMVYEEMKKVVKWFDREEEREKSILPVFRSNRGVDSVLCISYHFIDGSRHSHL